MALFKILNNFASGNTNLPGTTVQGYCYFDKNTGKFYIDTATSNEAELGTNRLALNAYKSDLADIATLANAAVYETTGETGATLHKISTYYGHSLGISNKTISLKDGNGTTLNSIDLPTPSVGNILNPVYFSSGDPIASKGNTIPFIIGTGSTAGTWLGALDGLTAYYDGLIILYKPAIAGGSSTTTLNINSLGAKTVYLNNTTKLTTHYPANQPILLIYSTSMNSGCWTASDYNANTTYSAMSVAEMRTGTATSSRTIRADYLKTFLSTLGGSGLTLSHSNSSPYLQLNHSNSITAKTAAASTAKTLTWDDSFTIYEEKYDEQGHITGIDSYSITMPSNPNTDTKVTSATNHYTPSADSNSELTASIDGTAGSYALNTEYTVLTGVKAQRDAKGHITGLTYTAQKIKDTNTTYTLSGLGGVGTVSASGTAPLTLSASKDGTAVSITGSVADASTSAKGVVKIDITTLNSFLSQLPEWTANPTDNTFFIRQDTGGAASYGKVKFPTIWNYIKGKMDNAGYVTSSGVTSITAGSGLSGGTITSTGTIAHATPTGASSGTKGNSTEGALEFIKTISTDDFGHVTGYTTGTLTVYDGTIV